MLFNQNIRYVWPRFASFDVENNYDFLQIDSLIGPTVYTGRVSTDPNYPPINSWVGPFTTLGGGNAPSVLDFKWFTDHVDNFTGYEINQMLVACGGTYQNPVNTLEVQRNYPHEGIFVGTNDVIYVKARQPAGYDMSLLLWPLDDSDFDVYASTSCTLPSNTCFSYSGVRPGRSPELVVIPAYGSIGGGERWIYIALGSHSGSGRFRFYANIHGGHNSQRTVSTDWNPSSTHKAYIKRILHKLSIATYLATEGRFLLDSWVVHWNHPGWGMFQFQNNQPDQSECKGIIVSNPETTCWNHSGVPWIKIRTASWCNCRPASTCGCITTDAMAEAAASTPLLHEFGHCDSVFGLRDEYFDTYGCGHSIMHSSIAYEANVTDFCTIYNGGEDHGYGHPKNENNWFCFPSKLYLGDPVVPPVPLLETPDAFYKLDGMGNADFGSAVSIYETQY